LLKGRVERVSRGYLAEKVEVRSCLAILN